MLASNKFLYFIISLFILSLGIGGFIYFQKDDSKIVLSERTKEYYWFVLHRQSNTEDMYFGVPGDRSKSKISKKFRVKAGVPGERPTPLPQLVGREYWKIIKKDSSADNPETAPYFLTLDVPAPSDPPYGPSPYEECNGQCNWVLPGFFGLHGVNGDEARLSDANLGSSGCIRHTDRDIIYLYDLLDPTKNEIRYYIEDN